MNPAPVSFEAFGTTPSGWVVEIAREGGRWVVFDHAADSTRRYRGPSAPTRCGVLAVARGHLAYLTKRDVWIAAQTAA